MLISPTSAYSASWPAFLTQNTPFRLPVDTDPQPAPPKHTGNSKRILVIDDEASIADSLTEILSGYGYNATACYDGQTAIDIARSDCFDMIISDVVMPGLNGVETVLAIRELCPKVRVLLFSGQAVTMHMLNQARTHGHEFELLPKPVHPDQLLKILSAWTS